MKTKTNILLPLLLGLSLAGCTRSQTDSNKLASSDQSDASKSALTQNPSSTSSAATANSTATTNSTAAGIASADTKSANTTTGNEAKTAANSSELATNTPAPSPSMSPVAPAPATEFPTAPTTPASSGVASADSASKPAVADRIVEWKLAPGDIKDELQNSGRIVRSRTAGANEPTGSMDNVLVGQITGKLQSDSDISALNLDVSTNNGVVTLNGTAHSLDQIGKAMALALDTGGVTQVVSTVKLETTP